MDEGCSCKDSTTWSVNQKPVDMREVIERWLPPGLKTRSRKAAAGGWSGAVPGLAPVRRRVGRAGPGSRAKQGPCSEEGGPFLELPPFYQLDIATQACFFTEFWVLDWPETDCCPPLLNRSSRCDPPDSHEWFPTLAKVPVHPYSEEAGANNPATTGGGNGPGAFTFYDDGEPILAAIPSWYDHQLFGASLHVLMENMDIALWATCLVQAWSPEMVGLDLEDCLRKLLTTDQTGSLPFSVTYVTQRGNGATMWAYTERDIKRDPTVNGGGVGLIIHIASHTPWPSQVEEWRGGGPEAFCVAVQNASNILHEMIHICGDGYTKGNRDHHPPDDKTDVPGTLHDYYVDPQGDAHNYRYTCWDEARMIATIFVWGMSQRYPCLGNNVAAPNSCCQNMSDPRYVAYSAPTMDQIRPSGCGPQRGVVL